MTFFLLKDLPLEKPQDFASTTYILLFHVFILYHSYSLHKQVVYDLNSQSIHSITIVLLLVLLSY